MREQHVLVCVVDENALIVSCTISQSGREHASSANCHKETRDGECAWQQICPHLHRLTWRQQKKRGERGGLKRWATDVMSIMTHFAGGQEQSCKHMGELGHDERMGQMRESSSQVCWGTNGRLGDSFWVNVRMVRGFSNYNCCPVWQALLGSLWGLVGLFWL